MTEIPKLINNLRIFPRIFISVYIYLLYEVVMWAIKLPEVTAEQTALVSVIVGVGAAWFNAYVKTGDTK